MTDSLRSSLAEHFPANLVERLVKYYARLKERMLLGRHEASELSAAKFAEIVARMIQYKLSMEKRYTPLNRSLPALDNLLQEWEKVPRSQAPDSLRCHIPQAIRAIYGIRNRRGVGHVADIDPNEMDCVYAGGVCDWILAELVRLFHGTSAAEARTVIGRIVRPTLPLIYDQDGIVRVLRKLPYPEQILLLLLRHEGSDAGVKELFEWSGHSNITHFKRLLGKLHRDRLVHYNERTALCRILPPGVSHIEKVIQTN